LWATNETTDAKDLRFYSSEAAAPNDVNRPYLQVTYSTAAKTVYFLKDHLGSIRATVQDSTGIPVRGYDDYDPWGYIMGGRSMASSILPSNATRNKFTGKEWDDDYGVNWYDFPARDYDPQIGRFLSRDPHAGLYPSLTPYNYAGNNPVAFIDPTGMDSTTAQTGQQNADTPSEVKAIGEIYKIEREIEELKKQQQRMLVQTVAGTADDVSTASNVGAVAGILVAAAGAVAGNPAVALAGVEISTASQSAGAIADITSTVAKTTDAVLFEGSMDAAIEQAGATLFNFGVGRVVQSVGGRLVARTSSSVVGPLFRSTQSGQFVTNKFGFTVSAAADATIVITSTQLNPFGKK
jgi:RHS repeat-associated protein